MTAGAGPQHAFFMVTLPPRCSTQMLSLESAAMPAIAPKIQPSGTCGQAGSTRHAGARRAGAADACDQPGVAQSTSTVQTDTVRSIVAPLPPPVPHLALVRAATASPAVSGANRNNNDRQSELASRRALVDSCRIRHN
jgi:hypothetical protein